MSDNFNEKWAAESAKFRDTTDKLGMDIDEKIFDTVIALNLLGISTIQSCEGHLDHSLAGPWVMLGVPDSPETTALKNQASQKYNEADAIRKLNPDSFVNDPNYRLLMDEYRELQKKSLLPTLNNTFKVIPFLAEFYENRQTSYLDRLILCEEDSEVPTLRNQGLYFQNISDPQKKAQNLQSFQTEMFSFTDFLKKKLQSSL